MQQDGLESIKQYVASVRQQGYTDDVIRQQLLRFGWSVFVIDQVLGVPTQTFPAPTPANYAAQPKSGHKLAIFVFIICLLIVSATGGLLFYNRRNQTKTVTQATNPAPVQNNGLISFEPLESTTYSDVTFLKPKDWQADPEALSGQVVYRSPSQGPQNLSAIISLAAGYDALGQDFKTLAKDKQDALLGQVKTTLDVNNVLNVGPEKDCQNRIFSTFSDISYPGTFLARQSTGRCTQNGVEKKITVNVIIPDNGATVILTISADAATFDTDKIPIENILNSIRSSGDSAI